jgi:hypothetical protein
MADNAARSNEGSPNATETTDKANVVGWVDALSEGADEELIHALWHIADSAWGRGLAAHHLANSGSEIPESMLLTMAEGVFRRAAQDGDIEVRGCQPSKLDYETIPRERWRWIFVDLEPDERTLYRTVIKPRADVSPERVTGLPEFDSLIVSRKRLHELWPTIPPAAPLLNSTVSDAGEAARRRGPKTNPQTQSDRRRQIEIVLNHAQNKWPINKTTRADAMPSLRKMAIILSREEPSESTRFGSSAINKILSGKYRPMQELGIESPYLARRARG